MPIKLSNEESLLVLVASEPLDTLGNASRAPVRLGSRRQRPTALVPARPIRRLSAKLTQELIVDSLATKRGRGAFNYS
jgi:hypothetical protein